MTENRDLQCCRCLQGYTDMELRGDAATNEWLHDHTGTQLYGYMPTPATWLTFQQYFPYYLGECPKGIS